MSLSNLIPANLQPKLLPCPCCGSEPLPLWAVNGWMYVRCSNPLCMLEMVRPCSKSGHSIKTVSKSIAERWNLRASAPLRETNKKEAR